MNYPLLFKTRAQTSAGIQTNWSVSSDANQLVCCIPPEFEGPGGGLSPEDLYAQALTNCFVATFKVYAEKSKLDYAGLEAEGVLSVDLGENKKPCMKKMDLHVVIYNPGSRDKAEFLADKTLKSGFILNSVKTELVLHLQIKDEIYSA